LLGGNGIVCWAEQWVPSGVTALLIASVPLWVALFQWIFEPAHRPRTRGITGLVLGFAGVAYLVKPGGASEAEPRLLLGSVALILASAFWAAGSVRSRHLDNPKSPLVTTAAQMLTGSAGLLMVGALTGEVGRLDVRGISLHSWLALGYLIAFGSIVAFSSYVWLLRVVSPAKVATYAYVNPVVAVLLGWGLAGEAITARTLLAALIILGAVVLIQSERPAARGTARREAVIPRPEAARVSSCEVEST
jgi:drug/metabolite transporter (DMT)-like permease